VLCNCACGYFSEFDNLQLANLTSPIRLGYEWPLPRHRKMRNAVASMHAAMRFDSQRPLPARIAATRQRLNATARYKAATRDAGRGGDG
jgi:hypothetical protein